MHHQQPGMAAGPAQGMMAGGMVYGYPYPGKAFYFTVARSR